MKMSLLIISILSSYTLSAQNWILDINEAKENASETNKKIVLVFQGSDWCAPCIKLDKEIWSTEEFKKYADTHFIMLQADFPRKRKNALSEEQQQKNNLLAETYNKKGHFPFVVVLNSKGNVLGESGYIKTNPSSYISHINSF